MLKLENEDNNTRSQAKVENVKELAKKELLELCKANLNAQAENHAWNKFNNLINNEGKVGKLMPKCP